MEQSKLCLPVLPLRNVVYFPGDCLPIYVGRAKSVAALEEVIDSGERRLILLTQKDPTNDNPKFEDLYDIGVVASVADHVIKLQDGAVKIVIQVESRIKIDNFVSSDTGYYTAHFSFLVDEYSNYSIDDSGTISEGYDLEAYRRLIFTCFDNYIKLIKKNVHDLPISKKDDLGRVADIITSMLDVPVDVKQGILETLDVGKRVMKVISILEKEISVLNLEKQIKNRIQDQMDNTHKVYYLNEKLKAIMKELSDNGAESGEFNEVVELEKKLKDTDLSKEAREKVASDIKKLKMMPPMSAEATILRNHVDWILGLPWGKKNKIKTDLIHAQKVLDDNHYGMEKVKERIIEYLAVHKRTKVLRGPILCLVGPPGVGKTSLAEFIASATGREFVRMSLGGVRDEAEIRGHRKTYIGSMPGKIIQSIKKAKSSNPLFLLDEMDKLSSDFRGDPAFALLEVLDPEHNKTFVDHYLEVAYDLSDVMFIATANSLNMPLALLDRMEIIKLSGYSEEEKIRIANLHLIDKLKKEHGLRNDEWSISKDALKELIRRYTRESGVRNLKKELSNLMRKAIKLILTTTKDSIKDNGKKSIEITLANLAKYAGPPKCSFGIANTENFIGIVNGLAYTETGGDLLMIEAISVPGKGMIKGTGKLGEVMQESIQAAYSYVTSRCIEYGFTSKLYKSKDIHVHAPEGAIPKEGPSAGVAISVCLVSLLSGVPVKSNVAMTGEVSLSGRVLQIGGLKEKLLAALRAGIDTVIIPEDNKKDLVEMPQSVKKGLKIIPVKNVHDALQIALLSMPKALEKDESPSVKNDEVSN